VNTVQEVLNVKGVRRAACAIAMLAIGSSVASGQDATRPAVGPERPFQLAPRVEKMLPNGLRVVISPQAAVPKVSLTLVVLSGLAADPAELPGLAAITSDAVQEGTKTRSSREIRSQAFAMGGSLTATAVQDFTSLSIRGLSEFTPELLALLGDVAMNPTFPDQEIGIIKQQRLQSVSQQKASPQFLANWEFRRALFGSHPYARITETAESIQAIDRARIEAFHKGHYLPNNAFLLIVGAVDPGTAMATAEKVFGGWAKGTVQKPTFTPPPPLSGKRVVFIQRPNSVQSSISVGNFGAKRADPRWYQMTVTNTVFGGAFNSRIVKNIREEKGYTYSPFSGFSMFADAGFYRFAADVRNEVTGATLAEVYKEIDKMRADGSSGAELEGTKQYLRGTFAIATATQNGLSTLLTTVYAFELPKDYPETYRAKIAAVTPGQVKEMAGTFLGSDNSVIVIVGDYTKVKDQLTGFKDITFLDVDGKKIEPPK